MTVIKFPGVEQPIASEDPRLEAIFFYEEAMKQCRLAMEKFDPRKRAELYAGLMASALCECGHRPSRRVAIRELGTSFDAAIDMINTTFPPSSDEGFR